MQSNPHNFDQLSELLSAYLDGEVTAEERALVEEQLAENAELRQLHDELKAMRTALKNLPRYRLPSDLGPQVLQRAEKAMLAAPAVEDLRAGLAENDGVALAEPIAPRDRLTRVLRNMRWSLMAVAIAVVIMVFNRKEEKAVPELAKVTNADKEKRTAEMDRTAVMSAAPQAETMSANAGAASADHAKEGEVFTTISAAPSSVESHRSLKAAPPTPSPVAQEEASPEPQQAMVAASPVGGPTGDLLIVYCGIKPDTAAAQAFEQVLANQKITVQTHPVADEALNMFAKEKKSIIDSADAPLPSTLAASEADAPPAGQVASRRPAEVLDAYLVEASPRQIEATLNGLKANTEWFSTVSVDKTPTADQRGSLSRQLSESAKDSGLAGGPWDVQARSGGNHLKSGKSSQSLRGATANKSQPAPGYLGDTPEAVPQDFDHEKAEDRSHAIAQRLQVATQDFSVAGSRTPEPANETDTQQDVSGLTQPFSNRFAAPAGEPAPAAASSPARAPQSTLQHGAPAAAAIEQAAPLALPASPAKAVAQPAKVRVLFILQPTAAAADSK